MTGDRIERFRDRHRGERCVIVANGPSLNAMDLSFLRQETVIGLNKIYLGLPRFKFYPRYLVVVNEKVIRQSWADLVRLNCVKFVSERATDALGEDALTYLIRTRNVPCRFCSDIREGVREGGTVTYAALQIAYFMGFSEVVIVGMDHRYRFEGRPQEARVLHGPDPNHFSADYFGNGQHWDNPDLSLSEESYALARQLYERDGRRIIDATVDGACPVFEKTDYRQVFGLDTGLA